MEAGAISMRYAKALFRFAVDKKNEDQVYAEACLFSKSLMGNARLKEVLVSPILARDEKRKLMILAAVGEGEVSIEFTRFIDLILDQRRESYLQFMMLMYIDLYRKSKNIGTARLITAVPVDDKTADRVKQTSSNLLHTHMELETVVDPRIEGGFIFDINGYRLDASISTQLKRVKQQFIDKNKRIV